MPAARRGLPRRPGRRPRHARRVGALPHVHQPGGIPAAASRGQRGPAPHRERAQARASWTMRGGRRSAPSARPSNARRRASRRPGRIPAAFPEADQVRVLGPADRARVLALRSPAPTGCWLSLTVVLSQCWRGCRGSGRRRAGRDRGQVRRLHRPAARRGRAPAGPGDAWRCLPTSTTPRCAGCRRKCSRSSPSIVPRPSARPPASRASRRRRSRCCWCT